MSSVARTRVMWLTCVFACGFTVLSSRLIYLQLVRHEYYRDQAVKMHYVGVPILAQRGDIRDRSGNVLAQTITVTDLRVDGKLAHESPMFFDQAAPLLGMKAKQLQTLIQGENRYQLFVENVREDVVQQLQALKLRPFVFVKRMQRAYPNAAEASHVLGFVNAKDVAQDFSKSTVQYEVGAEGVERSMDAYLRGMMGERRVVRDGSRREIPAYRQADRLPKRGLDVYLTIDQNIQHIVEVEADRLAQEYRPDALHIVVLKPSTGEILALANRPTFDANDRQTMQPENLRDCAVMNIYEPGSTFKIVTLAAALNEGMMDLDTPVFCENGRFFYAGKWLTDHNAYGTLSLREILAKSSNIGFAKVALLLGQDRVHEYAQRFGFGAPTQRSLVALMGEEAGVLYPLKKWTSLSITRVPMGYEVAVNHLQIASAYAAIANGGKLMEPYIVKAVVDEKGNAVAQYLPHVVRQVVNPEVASVMREAMTSVVSDEGTAQKAAVEGFRVAGKTGTAQKAINGAYDHQNYIASFVGFLPAERPEFLISIVIDRPTAGHGYYGGTIAAPAFSNIATQVVQQMNLSSSNVTTAYLDRSML